MATTQSIKLHALSSEEQPDADKKLLSTNATAPADKPILPKFDLGLAVIIAGYAFESYAEPVSARTKSQKPYTIILLKS